MSDRPPEHPVDVAADRAGLPEPDPAAWVDVDADVEAGQDGQHVSREDVSPDAVPDAGAVSRRRRLVVLVVCGALVVAAIVVFGLRLRGSDDAPGDAGAEMDAWAPYWALDVSLPELPDAGPVDPRLSPFWFVATGADTIETDPNAPKAATDAFLRAARKADARIVPSIVDGLPAGGMAKLLADPAQRSSHVEALAAFAAAGDYQGLDIDYEQFAFADDRSTWITTRPSWVAFITELSERLHKDGRTLTVSIPPVYDAGRTSDSGYWVYDYAAIAPLVDRIRVMAYDYSTSAPGPIAPLDWVQSAIDGTTKASGDPGKLVLGIPLYGYNWVVSTTGTCPPGEPAERTGVTARSAEELARRRNAQPAFDAVTGEWAFTYDLPLTDGTSTCTQHREVRYVDVQGADQRIDLAHAAGFDGVSLWALGYEPAGVQTGSTTTSSGGDGIASSVP